MRWVSLTARDQLHNRSEREWDYHIQDEKKKFHDDCYCGREGKAMRKVTCKKKVSRSIKHSAIKLVDCNGEESFGISLLFITLQPRGCQPPGYPPVRERSKASKRTFSGAVTINTYIGRSSLDPTSTLPLCWEEE